MAGPPTPLAAKSVKLLEAEKKLKELEQNIALDRQRRKAELDAALELVRKETESIRTHLNLTPKASIPTPHHSPPPPKSGPAAHAPPPVNVVPSRNSKDLPESALILLRELWWDLGYRDEDFVEMQMEISRELDRAEFARFEREMVINELFTARTEIRVLRDERAQLMKRLELNRTNIEQLMATEERTYRTLMEEREESERRFQSYERELNSIKNERDRWMKETEEAKEKLQREEKTRIASQLYLKSLEDRLKTRDKETHQHPLKSKDDQSDLVNKVRHPHFDLGPTPTIIKPPKTTTIPQLSIWADGLDDESLKARLQERKLALEEERRLIEEEKKLKEELLKIEAQKSKISKIKSQQENSEPAKTEKKKKNKKE